MDKKKFTVADRVGVACGILLVIVVVLSVLFSGMGQRAGVSAAKAPDDARTVYGSARGRNGDVTIKVIASEDAIYQIKVTDNEETDGIGKPALDRISQKIYEKQSLAVDAITGATISSDAVVRAVSNAMESGGLSPWDFGGVRVLMKDTAEQVETGSRVKVLTADDWAEQYPDVYESFLRNADNESVTDYVADYPMIQTLYEGFGFAKWYNSARGHYYDVDDILETGRPHALANCFTCKTPDFTAKVNELGSSAYSIPFEDMMVEVNEPISCYNCHANSAPDVVVTHSYLIDAVGEDFENVDASTLSCAQCHVEYYFAPADKATTLPYTDLDSMKPDEMLNMYNELLVDGEVFADYVNPRTGVRQLKVQHPEFETFAGDGSQHRADYTCADCHMGYEKNADGEKFVTHYLSSPLDNAALIRSECSSCHDDLVSQIRELQADVEVRTDEVGNKLVELTEKLAAAVESGTMSEEQLNEIRMLARNAQFYWDFVFVENSEGAHNSKLTYDCLDKAEALAEQALALFA